MRKSQGSLGGVKENEREEKERENTDTSSKRTYEECDVKLKVNSNRSDNIVMIQSLFPLQTHLSFLLVCNIFSVLGHSSIIVLY